MKTVALILFACISFTFSSCDDSGTTLVQGQIVGKDVTVCPCCGGYMVLINKFTYRFFEADLPAGSTILDGATYPLDVELEFENQSNLCNGIDQITIKQISKR